MSLEMSQEGCSQLQSVRTIINTIELSRNGLSEGTAFQFRLTFSKAGNHRAQTDCQPQAKSRDVRINPL